MQLRIRDDFDAEKLRKLCEHFYSEMKDNRPNVNDGQLGLNILHGLKTGRINSETIRQLARWCHTNGTLYQWGVPIAQEISIALFGRIIGPEWRDHAHSIWL